MISIKDLNLSVTTGKVEVHLCDCLVRSGKVGRSPVYGGAFGRAEHRDGLAINGFSPAGAQTERQYRFSTAPSCGDAGEVNNPACAGRQPSMVFQDPGLGILPHAHHRRPHDRFTTRTTRKPRRRRPLSAPSTSSSALTSPTRMRRSGSTRTKSPAGSCSASPSPRRSSATPTCSSPMNPPRPSMQLCRPESCDTLRELCDDLNLVVLLRHYTTSAGLSSGGRHHRRDEEGLVVETGYREPVITAPQHEYTRSLIESLPGAEKVSR